MLRNSLLGFFLGIGRGEHQRAQIAPQMRLEQFGAVVDLATEHRLFVVELASHVNVLRALPGEQKCHGLPGGGALSADDHGRIVRLLSASAASFTSATDGDTRKRV